MVELLPAERDIRILQPRAKLNERTLKRHDAAIIACPRERAETLLEALPYAEIWQQLYRDARGRGPVSVLSARVTASAMPIVIAFAKNTASAFERLTLAARAWKELAAPARARVLLATCGIEDAQSAVTLEALLAAALAATAAMPMMKSKAPKPTSPASFTLIHDGSSLDTARTVAIDRGNHVARWLTALPPNVLNDRGRPCNARPTAKATTSSPRGS